MSQQPQHVVLEYGKKPGVPPWAILLLLLIGLGGAGWYVWKEMKGGPTTKAPTKSFALDTRSGDGGVRVPTTGPGAVTRPRAVSSRVPPPPSIPKGTDPGPTLVTLKLSNVPAAEAFDALSKQAKMPIVRDYPQNWEEIDARPVSVDLQDVPFWKAMWDLLSQAGVAIPQDWSSGNATPEERAASVVISRNYANNTNKPVLFAGSFAVSLDRLNRFVTADLEGTDKALQSLSVTLSVCGEPKVGVSTIERNAVVEQAVDENGRSLVRSGRSSSGYSDWDRMPWHESVTAQLLCPPDAGKRIAKLKGYISAIIQGKQETWEIDDPLATKAVAKTFAGAQVEFREMTIGRDGRFEAKFTVRASYNDPRSRFFQNSSQMLKVFDAEGNLFRNGGTSNTSSSSKFDFTIYCYSEGAASKPAKLALQVPGDMKEIRIPFEFADLPMP